MKSPLNVSEKDLLAAVEEFRKAVGDESVFVSQEEVDLYRDAYSPFRGKNEEGLRAGLFGQCGARPQTHESHSGGERTQRICNR